MKKNKRSREVDFPDQGDTRTGIVMLSCILLFSYHFAAYFLVDTNSKPLHLQLSTSHELYLTPEIVSEENFLTQNNHTLAPFFFKPVPINFSDSILLTTIKGIGPALADRIILSRKKFGGFSSPEDLLRVEGIGMRRLDKFANQFSYEQNLEGF